MSLAELVEKTDREIEVLKEQIRKKRTELEEIRIRDEVEAKYLKTLAETLRQEIEEKRKFIAQRKADYEASGEPEFDAAKHKERGQTMIVTAICSFPAGSNVRVEYGDNHREPVFRENGFKESLPV